jgi:hypothetical protein
MKPKFSDFDLYLREDFGIAIFQTLNKPYRKANLNT